MIIHIQERNNKTEYQVNTLTLCQWWWYVLISLISLWLTRILWVGRIWFLLALKHKPFKKFWNTGLFIFSRTDDFFHVWNHSLSCHYNYTWKIILYLLSLVSAMVSNFLLYFKRFSFLTSLLHLLILICICTAAFNHCLRSPLSGTHFGIRFSLLQHLDSGFYQTFMEHKSAFWVSWFCFGLCFCRGLPQQLLGNQASNCLIPV